MDLQRDERFRALGIEILSVAVDPLPLLAAELKLRGIETPMLSDESKSVSKRYGIPLAHGGEPGHVFVLIDKEGRIRWFKDYGGRMYVNTDELYTEVQPRL